MPCRPLTILALALPACTLQAQGIYRNANSPSDAICPRVDKDKTALNFGARAPNGSGTGGEVGADSTVKFYYQQGDHYIPVGQRKAVAGFAAYDAKGKGTTVASLKGKVVLVGLWSLRCDPSSRMLTELANLYPKREQFGFEILAINFDENQQDGGTIEGGWRAMNRFMTKNRQFFEAIKRAVLEKTAGTTPAPAVVEPAKPWPHLSRYSFPLWPTHPRRTHAPAPDRLADSRAGRPGTRPGE